MLKKSQRLGKRDIEKFFKGKFKVFKSGEILLRAKRGDEKVLKFAFIISSSIKRNAVARNLTRRRMSEIAKELAPKISGGLELVFSFKLLQKRAPSFSSLKSDMINLLSTCGAL